MAREFVTGVRFAQVAALPAAASNVGVVLEQGGKLWFSDGSAWVDLGASALIGSANRWVVTTSGLTMVAGSQYLVDASASDQFFSSVTSLLQLDGSNGSTTFTDVITRTWTPSGNAQISTAQSQSGGASALFDGAGDYISTPYVLNDFDWYNTDFTLECFVRPTSLTGWSYVDGPNNVPSLVGNRNATATSCFWAFGPTSAGLLAFYYFNGAPVVVATGATAVSAGAWTHIAVVRSGTSIFLYAGGTRVASATISGTPQSGTGLPMVIGQGNNTSINGHVDGFRITRGVARYTGATYTVPSAAYPAVPSPDLTVPASLSPGDSFAVSNSARVLPGAGRQIGTAGVGTAVTLSAGQTLRIVARNSTQLDIV